MRNAILFTIAACVMLVSCAKEDPIILGFAAYANSVWRLQVENDTPPVYYVELREDGKLGYNEKTYDSFTYEGTDSWSIDDGQLQLIQNGGFDIKIFPLVKGKPVKLDGMLTAEAKKVVMERLR